MNFDAVIVGLGAVGSATLYHLVRRGARVLGLDAHEPPHSLGSSHGETRVIREAYFEHPIYVPFVQRAYELWSELERACGQTLYLKTGGLMIGRMDSTVVSGAIRSAREHRLPHEILSADEIKARVPGLNPDSDMAGVVEPRAGILFPERCVAAHLQLARRAGADIHTNEAVHEWRSDGSEVVVSTARGTYRARHLVIAAGAWLSKLVPALISVLEIERQVLLWFDAPAGLFSLPQTPIHLWEYEPGKMFYGFPDLGDGMKIAIHHQGERTSAAHADREVRDIDVVRMRALISRFLPRVAKADLLRATVCLYTNTPDEHFILDRHPAHPNVLLASPCSGHGFKFSSAIGETLSQMVLDGAPRLDLQLFALRRFNLSQSVH